MCHVLFINIFGEFRFLNFWNIHGKLKNSLQSIETFPIQIPTKYFKMTYFALEMTLYNKVGRVFSMVIWSDFRVGQYQEHDHQEDASQFTKWSSFNRFLIKMPFSMTYHSDLQQNERYFRTNKIRIELIFGQIMEFLLMSVSSFEIDRSSWQIIVTNNFCSSKDSWVILTWKIMIDREQTSKL